LFQLPQSLSQLLRVILVTKQLFVRPVLLSLQHCAINTVAKKLGTYCAQKLDILSKKSGHGLTDFCSVA
jgi:hypothetical protein